MGLSVVTIVEAVAAFVGLGLIVFVVVVVVRRIRNAYRTSVLFDSLSDVVGAAVGWGADVTTERQAQLKDCADTQRAWLEQPLAMRGNSTFKDMKLSGADVFWLSSYALAIRTAQDELRAVTSISDDDLANAQRRLRAPQIRFSVKLAEDIVSLHVEGADLRDAYLKGAVLRDAHLEGATLFRTVLEEADLFLAHLEGANFNRAILKGAFLVSASCDQNTRLNYATLTGASFNQILFDNTNLTVVDWGRVPILGDETIARTSIYSRRSYGPPATADDITRLRNYRAAVRANRHLAVSLRAQGMNDDADRYAHRAQVLQRQVLVRQTLETPAEDYRSSLVWFVASVDYRVRSLFTYVVSNVLDLISGYGYAPERSLATYFATIAIFAGLYYVDQRLAPLGCCGIQPGVLPWTRVFP
jgi:uncharacterized protein YjbI with pentapeptide repeats